MKIQEKLDELEDRLKEIERDFKIEMKRIELKVNVYMFIIILISFIIFMFLK